MQYSILSQINPFVKRKKEKFEKIFAPKHQPKGLAAGKQNAAHQKRLVVFIVGEANLRISRKPSAPRLDPKVPKTAIAVFDVGEAKLRINRRLNADLVILELRFASKPSKFPQLRRSRTAETKGCLHPEGISYEFDLPLHR